MAGATRSIVIDAPPERVFDVIVDYDRYAEFLSEVKEVRSSDRHGNEVDVALRHRPGEAHPLHAAHGRGAAPRPCAGRSSRAR